MRDVAQANDYRLWDRVDSQSATQFQMLPFDGATSQHRKQRVTRLRCPTYRKAIPSLHVPSRREHAIPENGNLNSSKVVNLDFEILESRCFGSPNLHSQRTAAILDSIVSTLVSFEPAKATSLWLDNVANRWWQKAERGTSGTF